MSVFAFRAVVCGLGAIVPAVLVSACLAAAPPSGENDWQPDNTTIDLKWDFRQRLAPQVGPEVLPKADEMDQFFESTGPYALEYEEREELRIALYKRYDAGFYEPDAPKVLARQMDRLLRQAAEEDGMTYSDIQDEFIADAKRGLQKMPDYVLSNLRYVAGNSVVLSIETLKRREDFAKAGMDMEMIETSLRKMRELRRMVIDEHLRRKRLGIKIEPSTEASKP